MLAGIWLAVQYIPQQLDYFHFINVMLTQLLSGFLRAPLRLRCHPSMSVYFSLYQWPRLKYKFQQHPAKAE